jgi:hypothetical protein
MSDAALLREYVEKLDRCRGRLAKANAECKEWRAMYDKIPRHEEGIPGMHFISVHNRAMMEIREAKEEAERQRDVLREALQEQCSCMHPSPEMMCAPCRIIAGLEKK